MGILYLRPFKKLKNEELLTALDEAIELLRLSEAANELELYYLNHLFREIKLRRISLTPVQLYSKILRAKHPD